MNSFENKRIKQKLTETKMKMSFEIKLNALDFLNELSLNTQ